MTDPSHTLLKQKPGSSKLATVPKDARKDIPLRAKSVSLAERPRSQYGRAVKSADPNRLRYGEKQFVHRRPQSNVEFKRQPLPSKVIVKQQKRKVLAKVPFAVSVQTLSIPMKYADDTHLTSKRQQKLGNNGRLDNSNNKFCNPSKQVSENKRLCQTAGGKETENKLLLQISEAEQVSDFERILNSNTILCERANKNVWRGCHAPAASASSAARPNSTYSLYAVSQAYHYLFQQHEDSLQPLIDRYRRAAAEEHKSCPPASLLGNNWYENLQDLSEFYEEDHNLKREIQNITDNVITEEIKSDVQIGGKNFNVNLTDLIGLHVNGEGFSPVPNCDEHSLDPERSADIETDDEKEWLNPSMNSNEHNSQDSSDLNVECIAQNLGSIKIDTDTKAPSITFSNCCDGYARSEIANNKDVVIHLAVPTIDSIDESRPPIM